MDMKANPNDSRTAAYAELLQAAKSALAQFEAIQEHQYQLLVYGQSVASAAANWDEATMGLSIDFGPLLKAVAAVEAAEG